MNYIRCTLELAPLQPASDIFIAALSELGFESFEETPSGLNAYIQEQLWRPEEFLKLAYLDSPDWKVTYTIDPIAPQNWNEVWERDYKPINVRGLCQVRAPFHPPPAGHIPYDMVISPKMSFGTGHHQTTYLMLDYLLDMDLKGTSVLDVGTGTGVLAILSGMKGASSVTAIDIDPWAFENCSENVARNGQEQIEVLHGDISIVKGHHFQHILANINKNVLLRDLPVYTHALEKGGFLLLSGYYRDDLPELRKTTETLGLEYLDSRERTSWTAALFRL